MHSFQKTAVTSNKCVQLDHRTSSAKENLRQKYIHTIRKGEKNWNETEMKLHETSGSI